ncbi:PfkB family carbohydrate kinase [Chitinophagaceae bacterium LWZ2-11]
MHNLCCIGHITLDKIVTPTSTLHLPGGTAFYFANAVQKLTVSFLLVTALADRDIHIAEGLRKKGTEINIIPTPATTFFENIYTKQANYRKQRVLQTSEPFSEEHIKSVKAKIFHLGPLLAQDIPVSLIKELSSRGLVSLDVQGYLRRLSGTDVIPQNWAQAAEALPYIDILKVSETELEVLTNTNNISRGAEILLQQGAKEVVVTLGDKGSIIYRTNEQYVISAYQPKKIEDATGCGDTYMAGYLYKKSKGADCSEAGHFASAMATLKIEMSGAFNGTEEDVLRKIQTSDVRGTKY